MTALYIKNNLVMASHDDAQYIPASVYGAEVVMILPADASYELFKQPPDITKDILHACASWKQQMIARGGFTVNVNSTGAALFISASTSPPYDTYLSSAFQLALLMEAGTLPTTPINWSQDGLSIPLNPAQVVQLGLQVSGLIQQSFTVEGQVAQAIDAGTITELAQIDSPPSPIPPWPVNS